MESAPFRMAASRWLCSILFIQRKIEVWSFIFMFSHSSRIEIPSHNPLASCGDIATPCHVGTMRSVVVRENRDWARELSTFYRVDRVVCCCHRCTLQQLLATVDLFYIPIHRLCIDSTSVSFQMQLYYLLVSICFWLGNSGLDSIRPESIRFLGHHEQEDDANTTIHIYEHFPSRRGFSTHHKYGGVGVPAVESGCFGETKTRDGLEDIPRKEEAVSIRRSSSNVSLTD